MHKAASEFAIASGLVFIFYEYTDYTWPPSYRLRYVKWVMDMGNWEIGNSISTAHYSWKICVCSEAAHQISELWKLYSPLRLAAWPLVSQTPVRSSCCFSFF